MALNADKMNTTDKFQVKSQLARLLAIENISIRHDPTARTAGFDVKNRVLYVPNWTGISNYLYDMLVVHEVGHALHTPAEGWSEAIDKIAAKNNQSKNMRAKMAIKDFLNVVEDARIDKLQKRRYPGSKTDYIVGYKELFERDFFGIQGKNVDSMSFIDRANIYFKGGSHIIVNFTNEEKVFIKRMERLETFEEVIALAEEIYTFSKENCTTDNHYYIQDEDGDEYFVQDSDGDSYSEIDDSADEDGEGSGSNDESEGSEEGDESEGEGSGSDDEGDEEGEGDGQGEGSDDGEGDEEGNSSKSKSGDKEDKGNPSKSKKTAGDGHGDGEEGSDNVPESMTEKAARQSAESIVDASSKKLLHVKIPKFNDKIVQDYKVVLARLRKAVENSKNCTWNYTTKIYGTRMKEMDAELQEWKNRENKTISFMVKEFEMRKAAATYAKISVARTGVIDTNRLHSYKYNDDIFRRAMTIPKGKNHGFVMLVDWSGSMECNLKSTLKQLYTLVLFCKKVQIPFEVYFFRSYMGACNEDTSSPHSYAKDEIAFNAFALCNILSSRMNINELNEGMRYLWYFSEMRLGVDAMGSTPLNQAILAFDKVVNAFQKKNKVQIVSTIVLTDGDSDGVHSWGHESNQYYNSTSCRYEYANYMLEDPVTKQTYYIDCTKPGWANRRATETFLNILKSRTNSHLIGFFIASHQRDAVHSAGGELSPEQSKFWKDNHYLGLKNAGYDEYFVINVAAMEKVNRDHDDIPITSDMSIKKVTKAFQKFNEEKTVNRSMLTNFIKWISSDIV